MSNNHYDSYCGIYCGACDIQMAYKTGQKDKFASFWTKSTVKAFLRAQGATYKKSDDLQVKCHGCKSDSVFINCRFCAIRTCAIDRKMEHCIECSDFPCKMYKARKKAEGLLPHLTLCQKNMESIKKAGVDQWLAEQEEQWQCPECRTGFAWYADRCQSCGSNLTSSTFKFSFIQSALVKLGIRLSSPRQRKSGEVIKSP